MQWLRLDEEDQLQSSEEARKALCRLSRREPLGLIAIFGSARQGKSFLMNKLAGGAGCGFKVSNRSDPCTVGVDLAANVVPLKTFCAVENTATTLRNVPSDMKVGFVDAEGQGDRDTAYDARIACPVLLAANCVIFNWRDSLQKDRMLDLLGVMCRAAASVDLGTSDAHTGTPAGTPTSQKPFGHLHIVFRDWNFDSEASAVEEQLLGLEAECGDLDSVKRNAVRRALDLAFESVSVWLLPPPVERTKDLKKVLTADLLSEDFNGAVLDLRFRICEQMCAGGRLWAGRSLTGPLLAQLVPRVAEALNQDGLVLPCSAYESMLRAELGALRERADEELAEDLGATAEEHAAKAGASLLQALEEFGVERALGDAELASKALEAALREAVDRALQGLVAAAEEEGVSAESEMLVEQAAKLRAQGEAKFPPLLTSFGRQVLWPLECSAARHELEALALELEATLPVESEEQELVGPLKQLLAKLGVGLRRAGSGGGVGKAEQDVAFAGLSDKADLAAARLGKRNEEILRERREEQAELTAQATAALLERMEAEEAQLRAGAEAQGLAGATRGLLEARFQELAGAVMSMLEGQLAKHTGADEHRVADLAASVEAAGTAKLEELQGRRAASLSADLADLARDRTEAFKAHVKEDLLVQAADTQESPEQDRPGLSHLLQRLSTAAEVAFTAVARRADVSATGANLHSLGGGAAHVSSGHACPEHAAEVVRGLKRLLDSCVAEERLAVQLAKEEADAFVRGRDEARAEQEALEAKRAAALERARVEQAKREAEEERRRLDEAKVRKEEAKAEKARAAAEAKARKEAEAEARRLATAKAQALAKKRAEEAAQAHDAEMERLKQEKKEAEAERRRLAAEAKRLAKEAAEAAEAAMEESESASEEESPRRGALKAVNNAKPKAAPKSAKKKAPASKRANSNTKGLSVAEAKAQLRAAQETRAAEASLKAVSNQEAIVRSASKRRSSVGGAAAASAVKRARK